VYTYYCCCTANHCTHMPAVYSSFRSMLLLTCYIIVHIRILIYVCCCYTGDPRYGNASIAHQQQQQQNTPQQLNYYAALQQQLQQQQQMQQQQQQQQHHQSSSNYSHSQVCYVDAAYSLVLLYHCQLTVSRSYRSLYVWLHGAPVARMARVIL
jgi:hypothetical protein